MLPRIAPFFLLFSLSLIVSGCSTSVEPINPEELARFKSETFDPYRRSIDVPFTEIGLYDAMALALKHNLKHRVRQLTSALDDLDKGKIRDEAAFGQLSLEAGYVSGARSKVITERASGPVSVTVGDDSRFEWGIRQSWNVLDLGLGYARAQQAGNRALARREIRHIALTRLIGDVQQAWWQAVISQYYLPEIETLENDIERLLNHREENPPPGADPALSELTRERDLIETNRRLGQARHKMLLHQYRILELTGLDPANNYLFKRDVLYIPVIDYNVEDLDEAAFRLSPIFRASTYENRAELARLRQETMKWLPSFGPVLSYNFSNDNHLTEKEWFSYGMSASWNLLEVFNQPARNKKVKGQRSIAETRMLAASMSVLIRNRVAFQRYRQSLDLMGDNLWLNVKDREIELRTVNAVQANSADLIEGLESRSRQIFSALESSDALGLIYRDAFDLLNGAGLLYIPAISAKLPADKVASLLRDRFGAVAGVQYISLDSEAVQTFQQDRLSRRALSRIFKMWHRSRDLDEGSPLFYPNLRVRERELGDIGLGSEGFVPDQPENNARQRLIPGIPEAPTGNSVGENDEQILEFRENLRGSTSGSDTPSNLPSLEGGESANKLLGSGQSGAFIPRSAPAQPGASTLADDLSNRYDSLPSPASPSLTSPSAGPLGNVPPASPEAAPSDPPSEEEALERELRNFGVPLSQEVIERWRNLQQGGDAGSSETAPIPPELEPGIGQDPSLFEEQDQNPNPGLIP